MANSLLILLVGHIRGVAITSDALRDNFIAPNMADFDIVDKAAILSWNRAPLANERTREFGEGEREFPLSQELDLEFRLEDLYLRRKVASAFELASQLGTPYVRDPMMRSLENSLCFMYLLDQSTSMLAVDQYDVVLLARPDLLFHEELRVREWLDRSPADVIAPYWHRWAGHNDRIAILRSTAFPAYLNRYQRVGEYVGSGRQLHAERFLKFALAGLAVDDSMSVTASRVRSGGKVKYEDFDRWREL